MNIPLVAVFTILIIWCGVLSYLYYKIFSSFEKINKGSKKQTIIEILGEVLSREKEQNDCPRGQLRLRQSDAPTQTARRSRDGPSCCSRAEENRAYSRTIFLETLPLSALRVSTIALLQRRAFE